ncbi:MAG TPA: hypothetical protein VE961_04620 [Pyrinomonadaceae bacterium]|nr:hypothetical protein [Pyrinomonadaceae bacterium]
MYCSSCGVAVAQNLTYCNFCGAKLNGEKSNSPLKPDELRYEAFLMTMMVSLFVFGMVAISIFAGVLKSILHFEYGPLVAFAFLSFLVMIALEGVLISRLFRRKRKTDESVQGSVETHVTRELAEQSRLASEPVSSVTDHTTRTLDPIYSQRK